MAEETTNTICIVDDNDLLRKLYKVIFKKKGFATVEFATAIPAIEWLQENLHTLYSVTCDMMLPDKNGREVLEAIRKMPNGNKMTVIAVTSVTPENPQQKFVDELGFDGFLAKPIDANTFVEQVVEFTEKKKKSS
jgi:CheY-like chemotaxis protein